MPRVEISDIVLRSAGASVSAVPGAEVQVNIRGGGAATVYSAESGGTALANPLEADAAGRIEGWLEEGSYDLIISHDTITTYTDHFEAVSGTPVGSETATTARQGVSIGKRGTLYKQGVTTGVTTTGVTSRHMMSVPSGAERASDIFVRWGDWSWGGNLTPVGELLVDASIEHPATGALHRLYFRGSKTGALSPTGHLDSDDLGFDFLGTDAVEVYVRTWVRAVSGTVEVPCDWATTTTFEEWEQSGDHVMDASATPATPGANPGPYLPQRFFYTPVMLGARRIVPEAADVVALVGDSNMATSDQSAASEQATTDILTVRCAVAGASITAWSQPLAGGYAMTANANPQQLLETVSVSGATVAYVALGTNDGGTSQPAATVADELNLLLGSIKARLSGRAKVIVSTCPPITTGTDATTIPSAQTPAASAAFISALNVLILDGLDNADWIVDAASAVEVNAAGVPTQGGQRWVTGTTYDGTHYSAAGQNAVAPLAEDAVGNILAGETGGLSQLGFIGTPSAPVNVVAPAITGSAQTGQTLTCSTGTWTGYPIPTKTFQWKRAGVAISGATNSTYVVQVADEGQLVKCTVTGTNASGSVGADSNTVTPTAPLDPATILGGQLEARWRASEITGLADGAAISQWDDESGNANHLVQASGGLQPLYKTGINNGLPAVRFDGTDDELHVSLTLTQPFAMFFVAKLTAASNPSHVRIFAKPQPGSTFSIHFGTGDPSLMTMQAGSALQSGFMSDPSADWHAWGFVFDGASSEMLKDNTSVVAGAAGSGGITSLYLGADAFGSGAADIQHQEVIVATGTLTSGQLDDLATYFQDTYDTP